MKISVSCEHTPPCGNVLTRSLLRFLLGHYTPCRTRDHITRALLSTQFSPLAAGAALSTFIHLFAHPFCYLRTVYFSFSLPSCKLDPGGVTRQALLPQPHCGMRLRFCREKQFSAFFLVDSHRIAPAHAVVVDTFSTTCS